MTKWPIFRRVSREAQYIYSTCNLGVKAASSDLHAAPFYNSDVTPTIRVVCPICKGPQLQKTAEVKRKLPRIPILTYNKYIYY